MTTSSVLSTNSPMAYAAFSRCSLFPAVSPAMMIGTVDGTPLGKLNPGTVLPGPPVLSIARRKVTTRGSYPFFGMDLIKVSNA